MVETATATTRGRGGGGGGGGATTTTAPAAVVVGAENDVESGGGGGGGGDGSGSGSTAIAANSRTAATANAATASATNNEEAAAAAATGDGGSSAKQRQLRGREGEQGGGGAREDDDDDDAAVVVVDETLFRLAGGLPRAELRLIVSEADECERLLLDDVDRLEKALRVLERGGGSNIEDDNKKTTTVGGGEEDSNANERKKRGTKKKGGEESADGGGDSKGVAENERGDDLSTAPAGDSAAATSAIVDSVFTPLDRYWTASALLGRLRGSDTAIPRLVVPNTGAAGSAAIVPADAGMQQQPVMTPAEDAKARQLSKELLSLQRHPNYAKEHDNSQALLALHKKVAALRSAGVFKRAVKPEEAPGYADRISFPMDLSLIRKMIVARKINTYEQFHLRLALISHNCVKFNGRESDYGYVAREFETAADELVRNAVLGIAGPRSRSTTPRPPSTSPTPTAAGAAAAAAAAATASASGADK